MTDKNALQQFIESRLGGTDYFLVDLSISPANEIVVEIDHPEGVDIDFCAGLTRAIEAEFPRDDEDYSLEVGSAGITTPLKVLGQYVKNIGNDVELLTAGGKKLKGTLDEADETGFTVGVETKIKKPEVKRPVIETLPHRFGYNDVKWVKPVIKL